MFDNPQVRMIPPGATLTRDEISMIQDSLDAAVDGFVAALDSDTKITIGQMLIDMATSFKLTYLLTPANIKQMIDTYMSHDPHRDAIEDMTSRFLAQIDVVDETLPRLVRTLAYGCSAHRTSKLLPRNLVEETVYMKDAVSVLTEENWLMFIASITAYYNTTRLNNFIDRNKDRKKP